MKSILETIKTAVQSTNLTQNKKDKAIELCESIYNLYVKDGGDFFVYRSLSSKYFDKVIKTKSYVHEIKTTLISSAILQVNHSYNVEKGIGKGYRFNTNLISGNYTTHNISISNNQLYHYCYPTGCTIDLTLCSALRSNLEKLSFNNDVNSYIKNYSINPSTIITNENITTEFIDVVFEESNYRYSTNNALDYAKHLSKDLILYKDKGYIDSLSFFTTNKTNDLKLLYGKSVFDIQQKIFNISRNETNRRLDYNLTNMKSELLDYLTIDDEPLVELDIANSQFAVFNHVFNNLDDDFTNNVINGTLYNTVSKTKMFRVAFDKVKKEQNDVRLIYPKTMKVIDDYKKQNGYKSLSIFLQNKESEIMIDGVFNLLINRGFIAFPKHDAFLVKKSEVEIVKSIIEDYFKTINFKCLLRVKSNW